MKYVIKYACCTHVGKWRSENQDNFLCDGKYIGEQDATMDCLISGRTQGDEASLFAVFDGMGGEACGEMAARIAAQCAAECAANLKIGQRPAGERHTSERRTGQRPTGGHPADRRPTSERLADDLRRCCAEANEAICRYADRSGIGSMGTTAVMLAFADKEITLCNIGDSKAFRFDGETLQQLSVDDYALSAYGRKPPLSQNLGIPADEFAIEPHIMKAPCCAGDIYLLCSDGLTDMVSAQEIRRILSESEQDMNAAAEKLLQEALDAGGRDNITILLCRAKEQRQSIWAKIFPRLF